MSMSALAVRQSLFQITRFPIKNRNLPIHSPPAAGLPHHSPPALKIRRLLSPIDALTVQQLMLLSRRFPHQFLMREMSRSQHIQTIRRSIQLPPKQILSHLTTLRNNKQTRIESRLAPESLVESGSKNTSRNRNNLLHIPIEPKRSIGRLRICQNKRILIALPIRKTTPDHLARELQRRDIESIGQPPAIRTFQILRKPVKRPAVDADDDMSPPRHIKPQRVLIVALHPVSQFVLHKNPASIVANSNFMKVVLDTNVLISAALKPGGLEAQVVNLVISGQLEAWITFEILAEYEEVLARPKFAAVSETSQRILDALKLRAKKTTALTTATIALDEDDNRFIECAEAAQANFLVTGNLRHYPTEHGNTRTVNARAFLVALGEEYMRR
jgi:putative PIN family toxin of toxin-antitoxin system